MRVGVLGTGAVGRTLATKLVQSAHAVSLGSRRADNEDAVAWAAGAGDAGTCGTFADAAAFGEVVFNCTAGAHSLEALRAAGQENLAAKALVDVANPLDFSRGMPPTLLVTNTDSLGEQIQRAFPAARVVKALNTVNHEIMVNPDRLEGEHHVFVCGDDGAAKEQARALLGDFGWPAESVLDLGDISAARATEGYLPLWLRLWGALGTGHLNVRVAREHRSPS